MKPKEMDCYDKNAHISLLYKIYTLLLNEDFVVLMNCIGKDMQRKRAFPLDVPDWPRYNVYQ